MGRYHETTTEPFSFYVDSFHRQEKITQVLESVGGSVVWNADAKRLADQRISSLERAEDYISGRWEVTVPTGCECAGLDEIMAPMTITLPGGRMLCLYPEEVTAHLAFLPGDSRDSSLWDGARRLRNEETEEVTYAEA
jgi:hypothetical protein